VPALFAALVLTQTVLGSYFQGDGMGTGNIFELGPKNKVTYRFEGCFAKDVLTGTYEVADDVVSLNIPGWEKRTALPTQFNIVRWGSATFLIANDEMPFFIYKLRTGWQGEGKKWGLSDFLRNDARRRVETPVKSLAGDPVLPKQWTDVPVRKRPFTVLHCFQPQFQPINGGKRQGLAEGAVLKGGKDSSLVFVDEIDSDQCLVRALLGSFVKPGEKIEPSVPAFKWRTLIKAIREYKNKSE
jgi:hypothetical protein